MYGIVNKAVEDLIIENYGQAKWNNIKLRSNVDIDFFVSNEHYDDEITFRLAKAASEELGITLSQVLFAFGEWWVHRTGKEKYGALMDAGGKTLRQFLVNLPTFHNRIMLMYPKLTPPEFKVSHVTEHSLLLHYYSKRVGLQDFVHGLLSGLSEMFNSQGSIELIESTVNSGEHDVFKITWQE